MFCLFFYSLLSARDVLKKALSTAKNLFSYFFLFFCIRLLRITNNMERLKTLEEMPGALSYLIEKVEGLEKTAQSLLNRQEERSSP